MIDGKTADNVMRLSNYYDSAKQHRNNIEQMIQTKNFDINAANDAYQFMMTGTDANSINHQASSVSQGFSPGRSTPSFASSYYAKSLAEDDAVSAKDNIVDLNTVKNKEPVHLNKDGSLEIQIHREVPKPRYSYQKEQASTMPDFGDLKPLPPRSYPREAIPVEREQANQSTTNQRSLLTTGVDIVTDFTPGVSNLKDASIALTGANPVTGEKVGLGGRLLSGFFALPVIGNAGKYIVKGGALAYKGVKLASKGAEVSSGIAKSSKTAGRHVDDVAQGSKHANPPKTHDIELAPGKKGNWNKELNGVLEPNTSYLVGNKTYMTDDLGRIKRVTGELKLNKHDRNYYQQGKAGKADGIKDGKVNDDGGHLIPSRHDGAGEQINYVPMNSNLNRGAWKKMENIWDKALQAGKKVEVDIKPIYSSDSKRPDKFIVRYKIDGRPNVKQFNNTVGGK